MKKISIKLVLLLLTVSLFSFSQDTSFPRKKYKVFPVDMSKLLNEFLIDIAKNQYATRNQIVIQSLQSQKGIDAYIEKITNNYDELLNLDFQKTPLNAVVTGKIECLDYRIEKVIFESHPNHHVTGNLYIPTYKEGPFPAVLVVCGHSLSSKGYDIYQSVAALLAKNGFVAFLIDTYSQGEMCQIRDSSGNIYNKDQKLGSTIFHTQLDIGSMLVGKDIVTYQLWNNIRAIDYLCSRSEVNSEKIGLTGHSGGGTQSLYLSGVDSRIKVVALSCGMQTRERMFTLNGPSDGCHHLAGEGLKMLEYSDYIILSAPKPILILAAEADEFFDINAVSQAVRETKWFYKKLGFLDRVNFYTVNGGHEYHKELREAAVWWFKKWLLNDENPVIEQNMLHQDKEDLLVTKTGQVLNEFKQGMSVIDLNIQLANGLKKKRKDFWNDNTHEVCLSKVKELINFEDSRDNENIESTLVGEIDEKDFKVKKIIITGSNGFPLPGLFYIPKKVNNSYPLTLYIDSRGKNRISDVEIARLMKEGRVILTVDLRGYGETKDDPGELREKWRSWNDEHRIAQTSLHIGKPIIGQRVQDVIDVMDYLFSLPELNTGNIKLIGYGNCGLVALHAAALDKRIFEVKICQSVSSWIDIINNPLGKDNLSNVVPNALIYYDLPDLVNVIKPRKVEFIKNVD